MPSLTLDRGLFWSSLLIAAGLLLEVGWSSSMRPIAFIVFIVAVCPLVLGGMLLFLWTLVTTGQKTG